MLTRPDLTNGILKEKEGKRLFLRMWPDPVFLSETVPGVWVEVQDPADDFNSTLLRNVRNKLIQRYRLQYPQWIEAIEQGRLLSLSSSFPPELLYLVELDRRIKRREEVLNIIPAQILRIIQSYPGDHFQLLRFLGQHPSALDLMESNPLLGYMVATCHRWQTQPAYATENLVAQILRRKRRDILAWLGFSATSEAAVNMAGKVTPRACHPDLIAALRSAMHTPDFLRRLLHLKRINLGVLSIIVCPGLFNLVSNGFLECVAYDPKEDDDAGVAGELETCLRYRTEIKQPYTERVFSKPTQVRKFLAKYAELLSSEEIERFRITFPDPPIPETQTIQALRTPQDVADESAEQNNCVWSLLPQIAGGRIGLYRVLKPERATLSICFKEGKWQISEIECAYNLPAGGETIRYVSEWLMGTAPGHLRVLSQPQQRGEGKYG